MKLRGVLSRASQSPWFVLQGAVSSWYCNSRILFMCKVSLQYFRQQLDKIKPIRKLWLRNTSSYNVLEAWKVFWNNMITLFPGGMLGCKWLRMMVIVCLKNPSCQLADLLLTFLSVLLNLRGRTCFSYHASFKCSIVLMLTIKSAVLPKR